MLCAFIIVSPARHLRLPHLKNIARISTLERKRGSGLGRTGRAEAACPGASLGGRESYLAAGHPNRSIRGDRVGKSECLNYVNGEWVPSHTEETYTVINPATGGKIAAVPQADVEDARAAIDAAREAFDKGKWPRMTPGDRAAALFKLANLIEADMDRLAPIETQNQGKAIKQSRDGDLPFSVDNLRFMAGAARTMTGQASMEYAYGATSVIRREPVGVVGQITPWNYPFMMAIWKLAPALAAGNTAVLKPASITPLTTLELGKLIEGAGLPPGTVNLITGPGAVVGNELAASDKVDMVSLTGDTATGKEIMGAAKANVKRLHLELGGQAAERKAVRERLVLRADRVRRHGSVDADRTGRGVRAGRERPEVLERGGGDRGRERRRVRALFIRVDEGRATGAPRRERPPVRRRRDQRSPADRERDAARRVQAEWVRERPERLLARGLHANQARVH